MTAVRIFVVDDREDVRTSLTEYLESYTEFDVVGQAASGEEALERLPQIGTGVDVVIMDLNMTGIDGITTTKHLRQRRTNLPIVICSLNDSDEVRRQASQAGAAAVVSKFDAVDQLPQLLRRLSRRAMFSAA